MIREMSEDRPQNIHKVNNLIRVVKTGWINTSDWTNRHLGSMEVDYDNLLGTFVENEIITGDTSGCTGVIMSDDGTTLILRDVTGSGIFQNNEVITGSISGATADVNEPAGDTKNQDSDLLHNFNCNLTRIMYKLLVSTDGTDANSFEIGYVSIDRGSASRTGFNVYYVDADNIKVQTGLEGLIQITGAGDYIIIDTEDWYYNGVLYCFNA